MTEFDRLIEIVATLRGPAGCPWDREQTLESLTQFVLEEAHEVVDAIERGDMAALREEIGDHIFEGVLLSQVATDLGLFRVEDTLRSITDKLLRRHPHVFQEDGRLHDADSRERAPSATAALSRWDAQKAQERRDAGKPQPALGELPRSLPSLLRAYKLGSRAAGVGFDWSGPGDVVEKLREEVEEIAEVVADKKMQPRRHEGTKNNSSQDIPNGRARVEEEMGDLLFAIANLSRKLGVEPEAALRKANEKFAARFNAMEEAIHKSGKQMKEMTLEELESEWQRVKAAR
jgi:ATP diphosphatase